MQSNSSATASAQGKELQADLTISSLNVASNRAE